MGRTMYKIMNDAQEEAYKSVKKQIEMRQGDKISEMKPSEWQQQYTFMLSLVENAIRGYNAALMEALKEQGICITDISEN